MIYDCCTLLIIITVCVYGACEQASGNERMTFRSWFSPPIVSLDIELNVIRLVKQDLFPLEPSLQPSFLIFNLHHCHLICFIIFLESTLA